MQFRYQAKDSKGTFRTGMVAAQGQKRAEELLLENGLTILSLSEIEESALSKLWFFGKHVPSKEMVLFSRQLSTLIGAQVSLLQSLRILLVQVDNKHLKEIITEIIKSIESGDSLSLSLARYPEVFSNVYVSIIHSGELSGSLDKSLLYLADQLEKDYDLTSKVKGAMTYPIFVLGALVLIGAFMFLFVLPKLTGVLEQSGSTLPFITVMLINITNFSVAYWWVMLLGALIAFFSFRFYSNTKTGKYQIDHAKITFPIIGGIFTKIYIARFSRNLSTLILGNIPIIKALEIVAELVDNEIYKIIILEAADKLVAGKRISDAFSGYKEIPPIVTQMIQVGEQSARLNDILLKLAVFYEKEVDTVVSNLSTLLEPIIILVLGVGVGIVVAGILLPIYNIGSSS